MSNLPRSDPLRPRRRATLFPTRGVRPEKLVEEQTDAFKVRGVEVESLAGAPEGSMLGFKGGTLSPINPAVSSPSTHDQDGGSHSRALRISAGTGLNVNFEAGRVRVDQTVYEIVLGSLALTDNATNRIHVTSGGVVATTTGAYPSNSIPLARVITSGGVITSVVDERCFFYEDTAAGGGGGAPTDADYLVGTANATLTNEIVVGTTPGGELGGTWAAPTVDATHSGSAHHAALHAASHAKAAADDLVGLQLNMQDIFLGGAANGVLLKPIANEYALRNWGDTGYAKMLADQFRSGSAASASTHSIRKAEHDTVTITGHHSPTTTLNFVINGGGSVPGAGYKGHVHFPFACTINEVVLLGDKASGSCVVDIWKCTYTQFDITTHPVDGDSITAAATPTISAAAKSKDSTLTGWTTAIAADDVLAFNLDSVSTFTQITVALKITKT